MKDKSKMPGQREVGAPQGCELEKACLSPGRRGFRQREDYHKGPRRPEVPGLREKEEEEGRRRRKRGGGVWAASMFSGSRYKAPGDQQDAKQKRTHKLFA